jgi:hypothetical protein
LAPLTLLVIIAACSGRQDPPPPVATASPGRSADAVAPMSSRDAGPGRAGTPAPGGTGQDAAPALPPGHPPIASDPHGNTPATGPARSAGTVSGTIQLSPKLASGPSDVLYVMAKKGASTLAVRRMEKPRFPLAFELSAADSMMAGAGFDGPVDVVARVSRTGDAIPSRGDLEGTAHAVAVPSRGVKLTIDSVRP